MPDVKISGFYEFDDSWLSFLTKKKSKNLQVLLFACSKVSGCREKQLSFWTVFLGQVRSECYRPERAHHGKLSLKSDSNYVNFPAKSSERETNKNDHDYDNQ